jgi:hypothetical protein
MAALWLMNLDADEELESPVGYSPRHKTLAALRPQLASARALMAPGDWLLETGGPPVPRGLTGAAWCPTPSALRRLARAGARLAGAPPLPVLQRANHRRFCFDLGPTLPASTFCDSGAEALALLERDATRGPWRVKRPHGCAGRGQRRLSGLPTDDDRRWLLSRRSDAGLLIEPEVHVVRELSLHGVLPPGGAPVWGRICTQRCDARGAWVETTVATDLEPDTERALWAERIRVAEALEAIGYHGPFGVDAYEWRDARGRLRLNPRSEVNARYTMGHATAMDGGGDHPAPASTTGATGSGPRSRACGR